MIEPNTGSHSLRRARAPFAAMGTSHYRDDDESEAVEGEPWMGRPSDPHESRGESIVCGDLVREQERQRRPSRREIHNTRLDIVSVWRIEAG